jgi:hypothetical protein
MPIVLLKTKNIFLHLESVMNFKLVKLLFNLKFCYYLLDMVHVCSGFRWVGF